MRAESAPLVSVVVATYNRAALLDEAVRSILGQTCQDFELIVVSDGSTDATDEVVASFRSDKVVYVRQANSGRPAVPRNRAIGLARGEYVAFCDDDDVWHPEKLERQLAAFSDKGVALCATDYVPIGDVRCFAKSFLGNGGAPYRDYSAEELLLCQNCVIFSSAMLRREALLRAGGFREELRYRFIEDFDLWVRVCREGRARILATPLVYYRMHDKVDRDQREVIKNQLHILEDAARSGLISSRREKVARANIAVAHAKACLDRGDPQCARHYAHGLLRAWPWRNKLRAAIGLSLCCLPSSLRRKAMAAAYSLLSLLRGSSVLH